MTYQTYGGEPPKTNEYQIQRWCKCGKPVYIARQPKYVEYRAVAQYTSDGELDIQASSELELRPAYHQLHLCRCEEPAAVILPFPTFANSRSFGPLSPMGGFTINISGGKITSPTNPTTP